MAKTGRISCHHCARSTISTPDVARASGWRMFQGLSQTGKELDDVVCPSCSGHEVPIQQVPSWVVECHCEWSSHEDWQPGDTPLLTAYEAMKFSRDHKCEPEFKFISPEGKTYRSWDAEFQQEVQDTTPKRE